MYSNLWSAHLNVYLQLSHSFESQSYLIFETSGGEGKLSVDETYLDIWTLKHMGVIC